MKWLVIIFLIAVGFLGYHVHVQSLKEAQEKAELTAYNQTKTQIDNERAAREEQERKAAAAREQRPQMAISKVLDPLVQQVEAPLNLQEPADLLPVVQGTKQRILDRRASALPERRVVFDRGTAALDYLAVLADERTKALKAMIHNRAASATSLNRTDSFFNQSLAKRWDETLVRARPAMNQLLEQLRVAEREWNKHAKEGGSPEQYDLEGLTPVLIPIDTAADAGPTSTGPRGTRSMVTPRRLPGQ